MKWLAWLTSPKAQTVIAGAKFWRKHHIGRHVMGFFANRRQRRAERQAARRREAEGAATEGQFQLDEDDMKLKGKLTYTGIGTVGAGLVLGWLGVGQCDPAVVDQVCQNADQLAEKLVNGLSDVLQVIGLCVAAYGRKRAAKHLTESN